MGDRKFANCGHRGAMARAPENTLASFRLAAELGATEVEMDLRLSKDGKLVVMHDATVDRTTDGRGAVSDLTFDEMRAMNAGNGQHVPSFEELLDHIDIRLQVEIKDVAVLDPVADLLADRQDDVDRITLTSFDADWVAAAAAKLPSTAVGLISRTGSTELVQTAAKLGAHRVLFGWQGTDRSLVAYAQELGLDFDVWPVNTPEQLAAAIELSVNGFTTDDPGLLFEQGYTIADGRVSEGTRAEA